MGKINPALQPYKKENPKARMPSKSIEQDNQKWSSANCYEESFWILQNDLGQYNNIEILNFQLFTWDLRLIVWEGSNLGCLLVEVGI